MQNFHLECEDDVQATIDAIKAQGCKVGLTIKPGTAPEALSPYLDQLDLVLVMSVEPGFGGQKFMPSALEKLRWLREERAKRSAHFLLEVDGGVDDTTAPLCVEAGADILVAGSAVFGAADRRPLCAVWPLCERSRTMDETLIRAQERELAKTGHYYKHLCWMVVPLLCVSCFLYGLRPLLLCGAALLTGNLCDRLVSLLRRRVYQPKDCSNESFALLIALLMPVTVDWYVLIAAVLAGVLIGKEVFGGYGSYPFNPAAVGYTVAAVSWPEQVFRYPQPYTNIPLWDASGVPVSDTVSQTLRSGGILNIGSLSLGLGEYAAPMGTGAALVILRAGSSSGCRRIPA